jgi:hypothetical protein
MGNTDASERRPYPKNVAAVKFVKTGAAPADDFAISGHHPHSNRKAKPALANGWLRLVGWIGWEGWAAGVKMRSLPHVIFADRLPTPTTC